MTASAATSQASRMLLGIVARPYWHNPATEGGESLVQLTTAIANPNVRERRPLHAVVSTLRALKVQIFPKQRLEDLLVFFVVLKRVDIHSVVDN